MQYGDTSRLAYIRGPEGIIVALSGSLAKAGAGGEPAAALDRAGETVTMIRMVVGAAAAS
jgi:hypothetical protein